VSCTFALDSWQRWRINNIHNSHNLHSQLQQKEDNMDSIIIYFTDGMAIRTRESDGDCYYYIMEFSGCPLDRHSVSRIGECERSLPPLVGAVWGQDTCSFFGFHWVSKVP